MTQDTFVRIIRSIIQAKGVNLSGSRASKVNALARQYSRGETDIDQAIETLKSIFADDFTIGHHEYEAIEKKLRRS